MVRPATGSPAGWSEITELHALPGCDPTPGIVCVEADHAGHARVWRRSGARTEVTEHRFPNWFLATSLELLAHLSIEHVPVDRLREAHGRLSLTERLAVVELDGSPSDEDAYRYLVLTTNLKEVETALVEMSNKRFGGEAQTLADLRGLVLVWHPIEQYLTLSGRTYFKGMRYAELRRLQFDLETTGLDEERDRIFMLSARDSSGWQTCLDTSSMTEAEVIGRFIDIVRERDPDVLENHNIFAFDLSFLAKRAARLGVRLALGRDESEPWLETDVFDTGDRPEPFARWRVAGRQIIDTQQAVRRFGVSAPDMRRYGLKDAARYFGFARGDREYVPGVEVWPTYRRDPERIRRYAADDVDEVDGLSRRLLPSAFGLASMLPRSYERIAADYGSASLWDVLLLRAYLHEGRAIGAPVQRVRQPTVPMSELFFTGVFGACVRLVVQPLLPAVLAANAMRGANDHMAALPGLVQQLLDDRSESARVLSAAAPVYLASQGLFSDPEVAAEVHTAARQYMDKVLEELRSRDCVVVEVDGPQVLFATPPGWSETLEQEVSATMAANLPHGVRLSHAGRYQALYVRAPRSAIMLGLDGEVTLVGSSFRLGRLELFGESFMRQVAPSVLLGDVVGLRAAFLHTVHLLRSAQVPLQDVSTQVTLHKSPPEYRRSGSHEEPYEVLLGAGVRSWRVGQRIRYFRARGGEPRLLREGEAITSTEADTEYYVQRLRAVYCQQFAQAFRREDFLKIFGIPDGLGPYAEDTATLADLALIRPISEAALPS